VQKSAEREALRTSTVEFLSVRPGAGHPEEAAPARGGSCGRQAAHRAACPSCRSPDFHPPRTGCGAARPACRRRWPAGDSLASCHKTIIREHSAGRSRHAAAALAAATALPHRARTASSSSLAPGGCRPLPRNTSCTSRARTTLRMSSGTSNSAGIIDEPM
jgi:hypothetical protein